VVVVVVVVQSTRFEVSDELYTPILPLQGNNAPACDVLSAATRVKLENQLCGKISACNGPIGSAWFAYTCVD